MNTQENCTYTNDGGSPPTITGSTCTTTGSTTPIVSFAGPVVAYDPFIDVVAGVFLWFMVVLAIIWLIRKFR